MTGTYKRNYEGDYRCTQEEVRQMLRDASDDPHDFQILDGFDLTDLDSETLKSFRQRFSSREPDHPWLALDERNLLCQLGGWRRDRTTGKEGLTLAGLLMFGCERSIQDFLPNYQLDYQELLSDDPETRWTYRLTLDGRWEPNLFNFYYRVYGRLINDLDVPFQLDKDAVRRGETHVHQALREALVNTLIHADHQSTRPIVVIKISDRFLFSNPGRLRIPLQRLYEGGVSDARNPNLQKMFQMLGLGEKAGSGFQKILRAWREQQWLIPFVSEKLDLEVTSVALPMVSLIPQDVEIELKEIVG
ncbi:ATP-binding protein, partial [Coleofasciculus sp.]|uniref:ATP-binding protein n=1 Tax=Coleofasciculus sp. TaxID=3100458 RepID=UPI003A282039